MIYVILVNGTYDSVLTDANEAEAYAAELREADIEVKVITEHVGRNSIVRECWETTVDLRSGLYITPVVNCKIRQLMSLELYPHYVSSPVKGREYQCFVRSFIGEGHTQRLAKIMCTRFAETAYMESVPTTRLPKV